MAVSSGTNARIWKYISGTMRAALSGIPTDLTSKDEGFLFYSTDYYRTWRRTSSAWEYAPGERAHKEITLYPGTVPSGWAVCDGSSVTITTSAAGTTSFTTPDLTGQFIRGGTYSGSVVAAVGAGLTGDIDAESSHTHDQGTLAAAAAVGSTDVTGGAVPVSATAHTHAIVGSTGAGSAHTHTHDLAVDDTGEPVHLLLLPIVKL
jgi:hypothetical protein